MSKTVGGDVDASTGQLMHGLESSSAWGLAEDTSGTFANWKLPFCFCFSELRDRQTGLIIFSAVLYFMSASLTAIPMQLLINQRIAGSPETPTAESAFVVATNSLLHSLISFVFARYSSGMGDYIGRKPVLLVSSATFVLSRVVYMRAHRPYEFYLGSLLGGIFDCYYFSTLAWICDVFPEGSRRSKRVGLFTGIVGGFGFAIGVPLGAILAETESIKFVFQFSIVMGVLNCICLILMPIDDTMAGRSQVAPKTLLWGSRYRPCDMGLFLKENFPISTNAFSLIKKARHPRDWLANFLMHTTTSLLNLVLIQYCLAVYKWSAVSAAAAVLSLGVCLGIFSPILLHRYSPVSLAFYTMIIFTLGLLFVCISGTGINNAAALGAIGIACFALGTTWVPALQTNLLSQYGPDVQGVVSGVLSQQKEAALLPAYIMSLGFTISLGEDGPVYFPGSCFAAVCTGQYCIV